MTITGQEIDLAPAVVALPAAALTAFARSEDRRRVMLAGFQTHVAKPVDPDELIAVVASGAPVVIADFSATTFCDCSSLRRLLEVQRHAVGCDAQLRLAIPPGSPVRRVAELMGLDRRLPLYPGPREAAAWPSPGTGASPGLSLSPGRKPLTMPDVVGVIEGARARIMRCQAEFSLLSRKAGDPGYRHAQVTAWDTLASMIELHLSAEDQVCCAAIRRAGPGGPVRVRSMLDDHEDIRELIREARLQPPGSPLWWHLTAATVTAWMQQCDHEEHNVLAVFRSAEPALRQRLARQWQAFADAQVRDQGPQASSQVSCYQRSA